MHPDVTEMLTTIGIRADRESLMALLDDAKKESLSADALFVRLVELERAERDRRNLARRTVAATTHQGGPHGLARATDLRAAPTHRRKSVGRKPSVRAPYPQRGEGLPCRS